MDLHDRGSILSNAARASLFALMISLALQGCGLIWDVAQFVRPVTGDHLDGICGRGRLHVGMAVEPLRPFVFPAVWTDEGRRVTGLDTELVREIASLLSKECRGQPVTPVLRLVRFRDLFVELNEGKLDLFVSAVSANIPSPTRAGLAYSIPYFYDGGITGITRRPEVAERVRVTLSQARQKQEDTLTAVQAALAGLSVAVQSGTSADVFASTHLKTVRLVLCDSLPAAFESEDPAIDVILGKEPVLKFMVERVRRDWQPLALERGKPLIWTREHYSVVTAEESYRLRAFINSLLFQLEESGRLVEIRRRWLEEIYAYPRRAASEGLPFAAEGVVQHYNQGQCRRAGPR
jgi:ABC-type amino acid transport substrate-binding protein